MNKIRQIIVGLFNLNIASYSKRQQILLFCFLCFFFLVLNIASLFLPFKESLIYDESYHYHSGLAVLSSKPSERGETQKGEYNVMPANALNPLFSKAISKVIPDQIIFELAKESNAIFLGKLATIFVSLVLAIPKKFNRSPIKIVRTIRVVLEKK
jgi:hypothetical protein